MTEPDWSLMRRIARLLARDDGLTADELAERLGVTTAEARTAAMIMVRRGRAVWCNGRVALPARSGAPQRPETVSEAPAEVAEAPRPDPPNAELTTRDAAVAAARRGWAVFPCRPGDKRPTVQEWERRARRNPEWIAANWPSDRHNAGIACGPSRLVVLDLDAHGELPEDWRRLPGVDDGRDVLAMLCEWAGMDWPETHKVATPSGGWHLYFTAPEGSSIRNSASLIGPQVDVRAGGGYVVAAGSVVDGKPYEVLDDRPPAMLPPWIARLLAPPAAKPECAATPVRNGAAPGRLAALLRTVERAPAGTRNDKLFWSASRAAEMVATGAIGAAEVTSQLVAAAAAAGLPEDEARRTISSAMRGGGR